ncbi:hypothetical protein GDO78_018621 [Eleutherodactylus coqui]|uniref:Uncharacterized protein n=1 Tax=Eleutherodactylus coqui TaxID=57060 RepID=A0A8J6BJ32_ELECQ|nr:hypothetical protein GDO78_018621 [Eleutherodactylus coqui]
MELSSVKLHTDSVGTTAIKLLGDDVLWPSETPCRLDLVSHGPSPDKWEPCKSVSRWVLHRGSDSLRCFSKQWTSCYDIYMSFCSRSAALHALNLS